jgi:hypothetical protein
LRTARRHDIRGAWGDAGQKRATPPVERDATNAPSTAAAAIGAAKRSERGRGASLAGCATASPDAPCAVSADDAVIRSPAPARAQWSATPSLRLSFGDQRSRSLLSHQRTRSLLSLTWLSGGDSLAAEGATLFSAFLPRSALLLAFSSMFGSTR